MAKLSPKATGRLKFGGALLASTIAVTGAFEGLRTVAYLDGGGVPTICWGETQGVELGDKATPQECDDILAKRLVEFSAGLDECLNAKFPDESYKWIVSWSYNVGIGAACKSTLVRKANAGDLVGACNQLPRWNVDNGKVIKGLVNRRAIEKKGCLAGLDPQLTANVDPADVVPPVVEPKKGFDFWPWVLGILGLGAAGGLGYGGWLAWKKWGVKS